MKLLVRLMTFTIVITCLVVISLQYLFVETRRKELETSVTISYHHTVDSWLKQNQMLNGRSIEEYIKQYEGGEIAGESVRVNYDGGNYLKEITDDDGDLIASLNVQTSGDDVIVEHTLSEGYVKIGLFYIYEGIEKELDSSSPIITFTEPVIDHITEIYLKYTRCPNGANTCELADMFEEELQPLFFTTNQEYLDYFMHDVQVQVNSASNLSFDFETVDVNTGVLNVTVTMSFRALDGQDRQYIANVNTTSKIYNDQHSINDIIANYRANTGSPTRIYKDWLKSLGIEISDLGESSSFTNPVPLASISAKTWYYNDDGSGSAHLGVDFATAKNNKIYAPSDGVILISSTGCSDGSLGDMCSGDNPNAVAYGGNQIMMLTKVNGQYFALTISHMSGLWIHEEGLVKQGDVIGYVGSSGNSTGPHAHIEMFYLGSDVTGETWETILATPFSNSFNTGWGETGHYNACEYMKDRPDYLSFDELHACRLSASDYLTTPFIHKLSEKNSSKIELNGGTYYAIEQNGTIVKIVDASTVTGGNGNYSYTGTPFTIDLNDYNLQYMPMNNSYILTLK